MTKTNNIEGERERIEALLTFQWHFVQKKSEGEGNEWVTFAFVELRLKLDPRRTTDTRFNLMEIVERGKREKHFAFRCSPSMFIVDRLGCWTDV